MSAWRPIAEIPPELMDGRQVMVKRVYEGRIVKEGLAAFATPAADAPMCQPIGPDPLGRPTLLDETAVVERTKVTKRWMNPDRIYAFPEPTHFTEDGGALGAGGG